MGAHGLNLGQIPFPTSYTRPPKTVPTAKPAAMSSSTLRIGPMFELAAGKIQRPFQERSSGPTALISSAIHGVVFSGVFVLVTLSGGIVLPSPQDASHLMMAILVAAPPPPPPPPAAAPPPEPEAPTPEPTEVPPPEVPDVAPELEISTPEPVIEEPPELTLPAAPALTAGFGSGFGEGQGSGFGVDGGVGFGSSMSSAGSEPVRVGAGIASPELIHRVEPIYPPEAVAARVDGTVVVEATVDEQGIVQEVRVLRSIGPLDQAAKTAVMQWRYTPLRVDDQPTSFILTVNVSFRLH